MIYRTVPREVSFSRTADVRATGENTARDPVARRMMVARPPAFTRPPAKANGTLNMVMESEMSLITIVATGSEAAGFDEGILA